MAVLKVARLGHPVLRQKAQPVPPEAIGSPDIQGLIDADHASLVKFAHGLHDAGMKALAAIDKKDADALSDSGEAIDEACEQCHLKYWYPPDTPDILKKGSVRKTS